MAIRLKDRNNIKNDPRKGYKETIDLLFKNTTKTASKRNKWQEVWGRSTHSEFKNETVKWCSSDNKQAFEINKRVASSRKILEMNGWLDKSNEITYKFNAVSYTHLTLPTSG